MKATQLSPLVGVLGHRQVGKTTLLEQVSQTYFTLDQKTELEEARQDPSGYIKSRQGHLVAIDECQTAPELFPALKDNVRINRKPGQFILSGSVRFTSRKAIQESLTGRIINLELLPFTLAELEGENLSGFCEKWMKGISFESLETQYQIDSKTFGRREKLMHYYFNHGGLPGNCFIRDEKIRNLKIGEQLQTLLDRDLRMIQRTSLALQDLLNLCSRLAEYQSQPIRYTQLQKETGISTPTLKKLIYALEAVFILRTLRIEGGRSNQTYFFEDQGEAQWLKTETTDPQAQFTHFCYTHLRTQFAYTPGLYTKTFQYRTRGGAFVPFVFANSTGHLGVIPLLDPADWKSVLSSANSFLKSYQNSRVIITHPKQEFRLIQPRLLSAPILAIL